MRRISYIITGLIVAFPMATITAFVKLDWPIDAGIQSEAGTVMGMNSGAVLSAQNIHEQRIPTSITKLLTALVIIENTNDLDAPVIFSHGAIHNVKSGIGNKFNLEERDVLSIHQYLCVIPLQSSNQSTNALAEYVAGSRQAFVDVMNQRIAEPGCNGSYFANLSGLNDDTQRITAHDMVIITRACFQNPTVLGITSARTPTILATTNNPNGRTFSIKHKVLLSDDSNYYPDAIAGKTGQTFQVGRTFVTYARQEGRGQIAVAPRSTQKTHYSNTKTILDSCLAEFKNVNITDNEIGYVTGDTPVIIAGEICDPLELSIESGAVTITPNDAQFIDADKALGTDLPEDHPQGAVARLVYTYSERRAGDTWIYSSRVQAVNATPFEPGEDTPQESQPEKDRQDGETGLELPRVVLIGDGAVLVLVLITGGGAFWFKKRQVAERERQRILREKRRQYLVDIGHTEEDFKHLLDKRREQHDTR